MLLIFILYYNIKVHKGEYWAKITLVISTMIDNIWACNYKSSSSKQAG